MTLSAAERARYQRHLSLAEVGSEGQLKLKAARVAIVGAGGLGSPAALYLAACGIGTLGIIDHDRVDASNLQRQVLFGTQDIGRPKAEAARQRLSSLNTDITVNAYEVKLTSANAREVLRDYDLVLDGTDRLATRYIINDACVLLGKPLVTAAIHRFEGQVMTYVPGRGPCYRCLFAEADDNSVPNCAETGVLGVLPGILGTIQATEAIKLLLGVGDALIGRLLTYDALQMRFQEFRVERRSDCAVCGDSPSITELKGPTMPSSPIDLSVIRHMEVDELHTLVEQGGTPLTLIDVREPYEFQGGHIDGAVNIPLGQLPLHLKDIAPQSNPVFICHVGGRSFAACQMALQAGIASPANLEGGMVAWQQTYG